MSDPQMPITYYDRFDETQNYEKHLFLAGKVLQSAECNEIQDAINTRVKNLANALFKDGDIISNAGIIVDPITGVTQCQSGVVYLLGSMRGIAPLTITIPIVGHIEVGVWLKKTIITPLEDTNLRDPAVGLRNSLEPGAYRLKIAITWGWSGDGTTGSDFYKLYDVNDAVVSPKEPPPNIDAIGSAIASYDRESTLGYYVSTGMLVSMLADYNGSQVYSINDGSARIYGQHVVLPTALRVVYPAVPDQREILNEPYLSTGPSAQVIPLDFGPVQSVVSVTYTTQITDESMVRGGVAGTLDIIAHGSVLSITNCKQGGTTYTQNVDYQLTGNSVDWSLAGIEPATGSTYTCSYKYVKTSAPTSWDATTVTVTGGVVSTLVLTSYYYAIPRYDRLCLSKVGVISWVKGVAADYNQIIPQVPAGVLSLATIYQSWTSDGRILTNDGTRMVAMGEIEGLQANVIDLYDLIAENQALLDVSGRLEAAKKGLFADPFHSDLYRDAGLTQQLVISDEVLQLPIAATINTPSSVNLSTVSLAYTQTYLLSQEACTASMQVNPYMAYDPLPLKVKLNPSCDNACTVNITWAPSVLIRSRARSGTLLEVETKSRTITNLNLRQISVAFTLDGMGNAEQLTSVVFDGIDVTSSVS